MKFEITGTVTLTHSFSAHVEADDMDEAMNKSFADYEDVDLDDPSSTDSEIDEIIEIEEEQ